MENNPINLNNQLISHGETQNNSPNQQYIKPDQDVHVPLAQPTQSQIIDEQPAPQSDAYIPKSNIIPQNQPVLSVYTQPQQNNQILQYAKQPKIFKLFLIYQQNYIYY